MKNSLRFAYEKQSERISMKMDERCRLLFGPYYPPRSRRGAFLVCERRGKVKVGGYSDGPIPWPVKWGSRSLILCGDLVRAVESESEMAVAYHWGVTPGMVWIWRVALGVGPYTTGTHRLITEQARNAATPSRMRKLTALAHTPEARAKLSATQRGKPLKLSAEAKRRLRAAICAPKSEEFKRQVSKRVRQQILQTGSPIDPQLKCWTPEEDRLLGTDSDEAIALRLGRTDGGVRSRRRALGIALHRPAFRPWTRREEKLLGTKSDYEIARLLGRGERGVQRQRQKLGIPVKPFHRPWTPAEDRLLGRKPDQEVARLLGRPLQTIQIRRHLAGIPNCQPKCKAWTAREDQLLAQGADDELRKKFGRSAHAIRHRRHTRKIPNPRLKRKLWRPHEIKLLGSAPDAEVAQRLGCSPNQVRTKRIRLNIRLPG